MKMVRLEGVKEALETMQPEVNLDEEMRQKRHFHWRRC